MDDEFVVYKLTRSNNNRLLHIQDEVTMKEIQTLDFKQKDFNSVVMTDKYAI
jgi:hypothetical protein